MRTCLTILGGGAIVSYLALLLATSRELPTRADAGGHWVRFASAGRGSPTVVLEIELSDKLKAQLAKLTRVVSYDRAGWHCSEISPQPRDGAQIALELHTALASAKVPPPYILVGGGHGGLFVRIFAARYPREVAGLVLVNPEQEEPVAGSARAWAQTHCPDELKAVDIGIANVARPEPRKFKKFQWELALKDRQHLLAHAPAQFREAWTNLAAIESRFLLDPSAIYEDTIELGGVRGAELEQIEVTFDQARHAKLPPVPVTLLTAMGVPGADDPAAREWLAAHKQLWRDRHAAWLHTVSGARHVLAERSIESIEQDQPELVEEAIRQILDQARRH